MKHRGTSRQAAHRGTEHPAGRRWPRCSVLGALVLLLTMPAGCSDDETSGPGPGGTGGTAGQGGEAGSGATGAAGGGGVGGSGGEPGPGIVQIDPADPHRFVRDGQPWYPAGYYPGAAFNMTSVDYAGDFQGYTEDYIATAASLDINFFRIWINWGTVNTSNLDDWDAYILHPYQRTGPGDAVDGEPKVDLDQFNPDYFTRIDEAVAYAGAHGMVVQLMLFDCGHIHYSAALADRDYFKAANNVNGVDWSAESEWLDPSGAVFPYLQAFVEQVVATVGDEPHIIWETCNEKFGSDISTYDVVATDPFHVAVAQVVRDQEDALGYERHLIMPIDLPEHRTVAGHRTPAGSNQESIDAMHGRLAGEQFGWNVPLITDNDCCLGEPDADFLREKTWAALTAATHIDVFNNELTFQSVLHNANSAAGMTYVALSRQFVESLSVNLVGMVPSDHLVTGDAWALARSGDEYVVYVRSGGTTEIQQLPASVQAQWFNPREGGAQSAGAGPVFDTPDGGDWVLHVKVP